MHIYIFFLRAVGAGDTGFFAQISSASRHMQRGFEEFPFSLCKALVGCGAGRRDLIGAEDGGVSQL